MSGERAIRLAAVGLLLALNAASPALTKDLGTRGALFPLAESDLMQVLAARLAQAKASGKMEALNKAFLARAKASIMRPPAVQGLVTTGEPRSYTFDPSYVVPQDLADESGRVFAHAGDKVNPLIAMPNFDRVFVFIDGDDPRQVALAQRQIQKFGKTRVAPILVRGSPIEVMRREKTVFYFDQGGRISERFGLRQVPAIATREGDLMRVRELAP